MNPETWTTVDRYIGEVLIGAEPVLGAALKASADAGLPSIAVSAPMGKFLHLLARIRGARKILEVGTLGGYSTIWLARALPADGKLITIELDPKHAAVATANIKRAGLQKLVDQRLGRAIDVLPKIEAERAGPFDLTFIDADKPGNPDYFAWALKLSKPGSVIIVDNVVRSGAVADATSKDASVLGVRKLNEMIAAEKRVRATAIQTVGSKGYDGFAMVFVNQ